MTSATSEVLQRFFAEHSFGTISSTMSLLAIALLLVVAIEREILRATAPDAHRRSFAACAVVIVPMGIIFAMVIMARFIQLS